MWRPPSKPLAPEGCVSSRKQRSFEVAGRGGFQEARGRWGEEKRKKRGPAESGQLLLDVIIQGLFEVGRSHSKPLSGDFKPLLSHTGFSFLGGSFGPDKRK